MTERARHLILIDASGFAHRAYHAGNPIYRSDGLPTWAILGFLSLMWRLLGSAQADPPTHAVAVFDAPGPTFRHKLFPSYKNHRPARDQELAAQLPYLRHASNAMGVTPCELEGFEADDVLATLATRAAKAGFRASIVSSDKDLLQTVRDGVIEVIDPMTRARIDEAGVREGRLGVEPRQVPDYQALAGDSVDNIPGIEGVGSMTAARLVREFGNIEGVVRAARNGSHLMTPMQRVRLRDALPELQLYRRLATLDRAAPLIVSMESLECQPIMRAHVEKLLETLEAKHRFDLIFGDPKYSYVVDAMEPMATYEWWTEELLAPWQEVPETPQCGYYERRALPRSQVPRGQVSPHVPVQIWRDAEIGPDGKRTGRDLLRCTVAGRPSDPMREWQRICRAPIKREDYEFRMADAAWAKQFAPDDSRANPQTPIDPKTAPLPKFEKEEDSHDRRNRTPRHRREQAADHTAK